MPFKPILLHDTDGYKLLVMRWGPILTLSKKSGEIIVSIHLFIQKYDNKIKYKIKLTH